MKKILDFTKLDWNHFQHIWAAQEAGHGSQVDSVSAYYVGGLSIESQQPTSATSM